MKTVQDWCDPDNWTAEVQLKECALPDLEVWERNFRDFVGESIAIRGVEVTVVGTVVEVAGKPALRIEGGKTLRLTPLEHKVQWDPKRKAEQNATTEEREAHSRLINHAKLQPGRLARVSITGPLKRANSNGEGPTLTVRTFALVKH